MLILIALYAILIPFYGIWGGVISSMLYYIIQLVLNLFLLKVGKRKHNIGFENTQEFSEIKAK